MKQLELIDYDRNYGHLSTKTKGMTLDKMYDELVEDCPYDILSKEINHNGRYLEVRFRDGDNGYVFKMRIDQE